VAHATIKYTPDGTSHSIALLPHQYTIVPTKIPGVFTVKFSPLIKATSITVTVDSPASNKVDYNLRLFITACFEHEGWNINDNFVKLMFASILDCKNV